MSLGLVVIAGLVEQGLEPPHAPVVGRRPTPQVEDLRLRVIVVHDGHLVRRLCPRTDWSQCQQSPRHGRPESPQNSPHRVHLPDPQDVIAGGPSHSRPRLRQLTPTGSQEDDRSSSAAVMEVGIWRGLKGDRGRRKKCHGNFIGSLRTGGDCGAIQTLSIRSRQSRSDDAW